MLAVEVTPRAAIQLAAAATWWSENRPSAPDAIRIDFQEAIGLLASQPGLGARSSTVRYPGLRRLYLSRIRYHVYYQVLDGKLVVVAFWHASRGSGPGMSSRMTPNHRLHRTSPAGFARRFLRLNPIVRVHWEPPVHSLKWSASEKKIARTAFDTALASEWAELITEFKRRAAAVSSAEDLWSIQEYLQRRQLEINEKYDYRYSQLPLVLGKLVREGRVPESQLIGLAEDKLSIIRGVASL